MPSFFYHLAFDLTTELASKLPSNERYWEPFQITAQSDSHPKPPHKSPIKPAANFATVHRSELENSAEERASLTQPQSIQALSLKSDESTDLQGPEKASTADDWRCGTILTQGVRMVHTGDGSRQETKTPNGKVSNGIDPGPGGLATKGRFEPTSSEEDELGWGIVRLYRDGQETPGLYDDPFLGKGLKNSKAQQGKHHEDIPAFKDGDCTTLCILAVPSYLTPSDFLGFVGEQTREEVSHFRMIRTERSNRYMVLMKFRNGKKAREWRREWNGKAFDSMEVIHDHITR